MGMRWGYGKYKDCAWDVSMVVTHAIRSLRPLEPGVPVQAIVSEISSFTSDSKFQILAERHPGPSCPTTRESDTAGLLIRSQ
jgi:hypothetical protein